MREQHQKDEDLKKAQSSKKKKSICFIIKTLMNKWFSLICWRSFIS